MTQFYYGTISPNDASGDDLGEVPKIRNLIEIMQLQEPETYDRLGGDGGFTDYDDVPTT